jgi:hypothetical protein
MQKFVLVASGNTSCPKLNIQLHAIDYVSASKSAQNIASHLSRADYFQFAVFDGDVEVFTLRVETIDPVVKVTVSA